MKAKTATLADIEAAAKVIGDRLPRQIVSDTYNKPDACSHCGPYSPAISFQTHLQDHGISYRDYVNGVQGVKP